MDKDIVKIEVKGVTLDIDKSVLDNMELVDALTEMQSDEDVMSVSKVTKLVLGEKNRRKLYEKLRTDKGNVPVAEVSEAVKAVFEALGDSSKNS